jgi:hypothetical protein
MWGAIKDGFEAIAVAAVASVVFILMGFIYFGVTLWVIKTASDFFFGFGLDANWAVLSAAILSAAGILVGRKG